MTKIYITEGKVILEKEYGTFISKNYPLNSKQVPQDIKKIVKGILAVTPKIKTIIKQLGSKLDAIIFTTSPHPYDYTKLGRSQGFESKGGKRYHIIAIYLIPGSGIPKHGSYYLKQKDIEELAFVLLHELEHVKQGHEKRNVREMEQKATKNALSQHNFPNWRLY